MQRSFARRRVLGAVAALGGAALLSPLGGVARAAESTSGRWPTSFPLPDGFRPEGVTIGSSPYAYFGSIASGDIHRASLATGQGRVISQGLGAEHPVIGLKIDRRERLLFLSGGASREIRVADVRSGKLLRTFSVGSDTTFVNDVILTPGAAWFTDSFTAQIYRLPLGRHDEPGDKVTTVPLTGDWEQGTGFTANGIERTPDGRALLMVNTVVEGGSLMRVDPRTGVARRVDIGDTELPNGDGLLLLGRILYVVQQQQNAVDVLRLNESGTCGTAIARITDPRFKIPTTAAAWGERIYLPNARFDVTPTPDTTYDAVAVDQVR
ncbi:superoxide dismutase [Streptomyces lunaelactis]|uniref:SMP-30/gluconolactonase/LRE family protein n=1 Tax=Streptomyces lunaelactis TaxID=1535768 RepID=UPI0015857230|nr:superoxide dismutase [Streptomyces lunaelactis]NUL05942.1 superoxide dismutase [Streptomyces lunaelactis]